MKIADLPTPSLVLDRRALARNIEAMDRAVSRHRVSLRPHMKTAKSIEVARMVLGGHTPDSPAGTRRASAASGGIVVSTLAEAEYFVGHDLTDILYGVAITPQKLDQVLKLNATGAAVIVVTDDPATASAIAGVAQPPQTLIEIDSGGARAGLHPEDPMLLEIAGRLRGALAGVMTHGGHSYLGRSVQDMVRVAETERAGVVRAAERLAAAGFACPIVSVGSTPTALHAAGLEGVTEVRAGVYMFSDLFQVEVFSGVPSDIAVTVLASVIGRRGAGPGQPAGGVLLDAGGLALSLDRSTAATGFDYGYGMMLDVAGQPVFGRSLVTRVWQEHALVALDPAAQVPPLAVGAKVRVAPNHACMTTAAHDRYFVTDDGVEVAAVWSRVNGW